MRKSRGKRRIQLLIILTMVAVATVVAAIVELSTAIRHEMAEALMRRTADQAEMSFRDQLDKLFEPMRRNLIIVERWGERGALDLDDHAALNDLFIPLMEQLSWTTSGLIATEDGVEYMLLREDSTWLTRATDAVGQPDEVRWRRWSADGEMLDDWREDLDYDPRRRPWYKAAFDSLAFDERGIAWTDPYRFLTTNQIGVTLSKKWQTRGETPVTHVSGLDVPLEAMLGFTDDVVNARDGYSFMLNRDQRVVDASGSGEGEGVRTATPLEASLLAAWRERGSEVHAPFSVTVEGSTWWADFRTVSSESAPIWLAVAVPELSLAGEVRGRQHQVVLVVLGVLLVGVLLTLLITHARLQPSGETLDLGDEQAILDLIAGGEGDRLEFKSTLRWNINTNKPGKEVEISWLKAVVAYLNTDGGVLLIGVNDEGGVAGIEADNFANEDKFLLHYNNLFKQHIGLEFSEYVRADIVTVEGKRLFVVQCNPSREPGYLKQGKEEKYYVRVGPSSRALSTSQVVDHVRRRK